jgi:CrcB protein
MQQVLLIAVGGSLGAIARYGLSTFVYHVSNGTFPWGTLLINLTGCFLIGVFVEFFDTAIIPSEWRSFVTIGFIGAYTTFSTYSLETVSLLREGEFRLASMNIIASNLLGIALVVIGIYFSRSVLKLFSQG